MKYVLLVLLATASFSAIAETVIDPVENSCKKFKRMKH